MMKLNIYCILVNQAEAEVLGITYFLRIRQTYNFFVNILKFTLKKN